MNKLMLFELNKIWGKKSFIASIVTILLVNLFLVWYMNLPNDYEPDIYSYKALGSDISDMTEKEKYEYIEKLKVDIDGYVLVDDVIIYSSIPDEFSEDMVRQIKEENPGVFEKYYDSYQKGNYLKYCDTLLKEEQFINDAYEEMIKVSGYKDYIFDVQNNKNRLSVISIFSNLATEDNFSNRNIEKSASDYEKMSDVKINFYPSKGIVSATNNRISDMLMILFVFLLVGNLIYEEKQKNLFYITKATAGGRSKNILSKLLSLLINSVFISLLIYLENLFFFGTTTGIGDLSTSIQSISTYMESILHINVLQYIALVVVTKGLVLFIIGCILTIVSIIAKQSFTQYIVGVVLIAVSEFLYEIISAASGLNWFKYLNPIGLLRADIIYGGYLNFNFFGNPFPRIKAVWMTIVLLIVTGVTLTVIVFLKWDNIETKKINCKFGLKYRPHSNLLKHESYKIFIVNKALPVILIFSVFIGYRYMSNVYEPTAGEMYYQEIMLSLEGGLDKEKEKIIETENRRYQEAFDKIAKIDEMIAEGKISELNGEDMKRVYESQVIFYPQFQRVLTQYDHIKDEGGEFVYDTGYLILFGLADEGYLIDMILLSICMVLSFAAVMATEYEKKSWNLISATKKGKKHIIKRKIIICLTTSVIISWVPWIFRVMQIKKNYPLNMLETSLANIPHYMDKHISMSIIASIISMMVIQAVVIMAITIIVLLISFKTKSYHLALFVSMLVLVIPIVLKFMGFDFAQYLSLFPMYNLSATL